MAKKSKKISVNALEKAISENCEKKRSVEWNGLEIEIKKNINLDEMYAFVDGVTTACFNEATGAYAPQKKDLLIRAIVVELYTNLSLPASVQKKYDILYGTDLFAMIVAHIDNEQLANIINAIEENLRLLTGMGVVAVTKRIDDIVGEFEKLEKTLAGLFTDVDGADVRKVINAISENGLDEEKLMQAYLKAKEPAEDKNLGAV